jgi:hypothetical protein
MPRHLRTIVIRKTGAEEGWARWPDERRWKGPSIGWQGCSPRAVFVALFESMRRPISLFGGECVAEGEVAGAHLPATLTTACPRLPPRFINTLKTFSLFHPLQPHRCFSHGTYHFR